MPTIKKESGPPKLISNQEVMELLEQRYQERMKKRKRFNKTTTSSSQHCEWMEEKVIHYLKTITPCMRLQSHRRNELRTTLQSSSPNKRKATATTTTIATTTGFGLTDAESLQIVNSMPMEPVELHLLIEDLHARMTDRQQTELLQYIASFVTTTTAPTTTSTILNTNSLDQVETIKQEEEENFTL